MRPTGDPPLPDLDAFQHAVQDGLGLEGRITEFGVSRILHLVLERRPIDIGTNGSYVWILADLGWPNFAADAVLYYAPDETYKRVKLLEEGTKPSLTGDPVFDGKYLLLGPAASTLSSSLTDEVRSLLLEFSDLRPDIHGLELGGEPLRVIPRVHIRSEPDLRSDPIDHPSVRFGDGHFTADHVARFARDANDLATRLELALGKRPG